MVLSEGNVEAQLCFRKLLLDQLYQSLRLAKVYDGVVVTMYDPTSQS